MLDPAAEADQPGGDLLSPGGVLEEEEGSRGFAMDVLRTHPLVIIGGVLQENPFVVPPDELLSEIRDARSRRLPASRNDAPAVSTA